MVLQSRGTSVLCHCRSNMSIHARKERPIVSHWDDSTVPKRLRFRITKSHDVQNLHRNVPDRKNIRPQGIPRIYSNSTRTNAGSNRCLYLVRLRCSFTPYPYPVQPVVWGILESMKNCYAIFGVWHGGSLGGIDTHNIIAKKRDLVHRWTVGGVGDGWKRSHDCSEKEDIERHDVYPNHDTDLPILGHF